jgi:membrane protein YqaA with SNARE-associated domain
MKRAAATVALGWRALGSGTVVVGSTEVVVAGLVVVVEDGDAVG